MYVCIIINLEIQAKNTPQVRTQLRQRRPLPRIMVTTTIITEIVRTAVTTGVTTTVIKVKGQLATRSSRIIK